MIGPVNVSYQLYDSTGSLVPLEADRLEGRGKYMPPGEYFLIVAVAANPDARTATGHYKLDLVVSAYSDFPEIQPTMGRLPGRPVAVLLNLSPWQAWVHLYCQKDQPASDDDTGAPCTVRFE